MEVVMIILAGILVAAAVYLILSRSLLRVIIGTSILTHAVNLLLLSMGGLEEGAIPIYGKEIKRYVDPIPPGADTDSYRHQFRYYSFYTRSGVSKLQRTRYR